MSQAKHPQQILYEATLLHEAGRLAEAERLYVQVLALMPERYEALHMFGLMRLQQGRYDEAQVLVAAALRQSPDAVETISNHGLILRALGKNGEALAAFNRAVALRPDNAKAWNNRGCLLLEDMGRINEALASFTHAVTATPDFPEGHNNKGLALNRLELYSESLPCFDRAVRLRPDYREAWHNRGTALRGLRRYPEALASLDRALSLDARHAGAWNDRGNVLRDMNDLPEALASFDRAIVLNPDFPEALCNRAELSWTFLKALAPAISDLRAVLRIAPDYPYARGNLLHLNMYAGDWRDYDRETRLIDEGVRAGKPVAEPFVFQGMTHSAADMLICSRSYATKEYPARPPFWHGGARKPGKIRIGYVCSEFRQQATTSLAVGLFENHDKTQFEITAFDNGMSDGSAMRARLEAAFDNFVAIGALPTESAVRAIEAQEIDILVNLNGYFGDMRMDIFARQPAPIQVNYLGFPATLGADYIDYIVADRCVIPESEQCFYAEKVVWLPNSYQPNDDRRGAGPQTSRTDHGLPERGFVFCHFNQSYKLTPDIFAIWMRLLKAIDASVLWLLSTGELFQKNIRREAEIHGVASDRIIFAGHLRADEHLARLAHGDLFLDSLPCNAHTTASDALWAGLPLLTCRGTSFSGRVAASLLYALDMPELVAEDLKSYEAKALCLAREKKILADLRQRLSITRRSAPLFDAPGYVRHLEVAYHKMFDISQQRRSPVAFAV